MIVVIVLLTIIAINSSISIYEFFKNVKKQRYESIRKEILHASDNGNIDTTFWD